MERYPNIILAECLSAQKKQRKREGDAVKLSTPTANQKSFPNVVGDQLQAGEAIRKNDQDIIDEVNGEKQCQQHFIFEKMLTLSNG